MIAVLHELFRGQQSEWMLVERKALRWLKKTLAAHVPASASGVTGASGNADDLIAAAAAAVQALTA